MLQNVRADQLSKLVPRMEHRNLVGIFALMTVGNKYRITRTQGLHIGLIDTSDLAMPALATSPVTIRVPPSRTVPATRSLPARVEAIVIVLQQWEGVVVAGGGLDRGMKPCVG